MDGVSAEDAFKHWCEHCGQEAKRRKALASPPSEEATPVVWILEVVGSHAPQPVLAFATRAAAVAYAERIEPPCGRWYKVAPRDAPADGDVSWECEAGERWAELLVTRTEVRQW